MSRNFWLSADSYKHDHYNMMVPGIEKLSAYVEARPGRKMSEVRFFGLQGYINDYLISSLDPYERLEADDILELHGTPLNPASKSLLGLGHVPLRISALPEGIIVPTGVPQVLVESTHPNFAWLATWIETQLLRGVWYPSTVCTNSYRMMTHISKAYDASGSDRAGLPFTLHDFGARGATCGEAAAIGGAAHLVNSRGSDTNEALSWVAENYGDPCAGNSIYAAEHSAILTWGPAKRREFYEHVINHYGRQEGAMLSIVMDTVDQSADFELFCREDGLMPLIRETFGTNGGKLVLRPDTGEPEMNVVEYPDLMMSAYGHHETVSGYRRLPDYLGLIQGDGIDENKLVECLEAMDRNRIAIQGIAFGSGGGLLQKVNRDDAGYAMKACLVTANGETYGVQKTPFGHPEKNSKAGNLAVTRDENGELISITVEELRGRENLLQVVYEDGDLVRNMSFQEVRDNAVI